MPEFLSPGVYIEEVSSGTPTIEGVSTSTVASIGYTERGPENTATLVTNFNQFLTTFGSWVQESFNPLAVAAFFQNGGKRAYIVRVVPGDATYGDAKVLSQHVRDEVSEGDGTTTISETALTTGFAVNDGDTPIQPGTVDMRWRSAGVPRANEVMTERDGSTSLAASAGVLFYEGRVNASSLPDAHPSLLAFDSTVALTLEWTTAAVGTSITIPAPASGQWTASATNGAGSSAIFDWRTGAFSILMDATETPDASTDLTWSGTPAAGDPGESAVSQVGSGANGTVSLVVFARGVAGNSYLLEVVDPSPSLSVPLGAAFAASKLTITLATDGGGALDAAANTAALVAAAVEALAELRATASGTGADSLTSAEAEKSFTGGRAALAYWQVEDDGAGALIESVSEPLSADGSLTYADGAFSMTTVSGAAAVGTLTPVAQASIADNETFVLDDGVNPAVTFEFDQSGGATIPSTSVTVDISGDTTDQTVSDTIVGVVNGVSALNLTAANTGGTVVPVTLTNDNDGPEGNATWSEAVADAGFTVDQPVGGERGAEPWNGAAVASDYDIQAWNMAPISRGDWSDDLRLVITRNVDYFAAATASSSRYDLSVQLYNEDLLSYETYETFDEVDFVDPTGTRYFADVLNAASSYINVELPGGDEAPGEMAGLLHNLTLGGGDQTAAGRTFTDADTGTLEGSIGPRSVIVSYTAVDGSAKSITDDGSGNLIGDVDPAGTNTITYATGAYDLTTLDNIKAGTLVNALWYVDPAADSVSEQFGDDAKSYTSGTNGTFDSTNYGRSQFTDLALQSSSSGLYALDRVSALLQVIIPDFVGNETITRDILDYVDSRVAQPSGADRFAILAVPKGLTAQDAVDWFRFTLLRNSKYAAMYAPWVNVADPLSDGRDITMPPIGHLAGIYARTDTTRNVSKAPAGQVDGQLRFLNSLETVFTQGEMDVLHPAKVMPLKSDPNIGNAVWGARTISTQSEWRYIQAVRLFMFIGRSIYNSTQWVVFENNGRALWSRIKVQLDGFLGQLYAEQYFSGATPSDAYQVVVDETNNTQATIDAGQVIVDVYVAPTKPAEFVRFRLAQKVLE